MQRNIFVFGSDLAGRHGKGSALEALRHYGAVYHRGVGPQGNSYAIPTKNYVLETLPISTIKKHVDNFIKYAKENPESTFNVVKIGCGLAGYKEEEIMPLFAGSPSNVNLPLGWRQMGGSS